MTIGWTMEWASPIKGASCTTLNLDALNLLEREFLDKMLITILIEREAA